MVLLIMLIAVPICLFEGAPLLKQKRWKELIVLLILIGITLLIGIGKAVGWPTPFELLDRWLLPLGKALFKQY